MLNFIKKIYNKIDSKIFWYKMHHEQAICKNCGKKFGKKCFNPYHGKFRELKTNPYKHGYFCDECGNKIGTFRDKKDVNIKYVK